MSIVFAFMGFEPVVELNNNNNSNNRLLMKLFKPSNIDTINERRNSFAFQLPSEHLQRRKENFNMKIMECRNMPGCFVLYKLNLPIGVK